MSKYQLNLEQRKDRPDRLGKCFIRIRLYFNNRSRYITTGVKVHPKDWNEEAQMIKHTVPNAAHLNFMISDMKQGFEREIMDVERMTGGINSSKINKIFCNKNMFDFHDYAKDYFITFKSKFKPETLVSYGYDLEKLREFSPVLTMNDITPEFVAKYHSFLKDVRGNSQNTCNKALKPIKKVLRYAREVDKLINEDPFVVYNISKVETIPTYLEPDEINLLWDLCVVNPKELNESLRYTGLYFLLSCYTGLRYSDLQQVHEKDIIKNDRVSLSMVKGQAPLRLPLLTRATTLTKLIGTKKVLSNQKGNEYLKILQDLAGIKKSLHWHMGRHTMAMLLSDLGFDKEITAVMLGHKSLKSTATYHRISSARGMKEVEAFQKQLDSIGHN